MQPSPSRSPSPTTRSTRGRGFSRALVGLALRRARRRRDRRCGRARARHAGRRRHPHRRAECAAPRHGRAIRPFHLLCAGEANEPAENSADLVIDAVGAAATPRRRIANGRARRRHRPRRALARPRRARHPQAHLAGGRSSPAPIATRRPIFARRSRRSPRAGSAIFPGSRSARFRRAHAPSPTSTPTRSRPRRSCCGRSRGGWRSDISASRRRNSRARPCSVNDRSRKARPRVYCR